MKTRRFWDWLVNRDDKGHRGLDNVFDDTFFIIFLLSLSVAIILPISPSALASRAAFPASAVLIGMSFAWAGRVSALLQDKSFSKFIIQNGRSPEDYVYAFQLAILMVIIFVVFSIFVVVAYEELCLLPRYFLGKFILCMQICICAASLRECWGIINFVNELTIAFYVVRKTEIEAEKQ